jgi:Ser/Thr protein kinase RdoA (MazF antagonist)
MEFQRSVVEQVASRFTLPDVKFAAKPLGQGLINDTFLIQADERSFVLQRINSAVFKDPEKVQNNFETITAHSEQFFVRVRGYQWHLPSAIPCQDGSGFHRSPEGDVWRAMSLIEGGVSWGRLVSTDQADALGKSLGIFHTMSASLDPAKLFDTLPGFHVAPRYLERLDAVLSSEVGYQRSKACGSALSLVDQQRPRIDVLEKARLSGELTERVTHGDPKLDNFLFSAQNGQALAMLDLDTVKPGLILYDLADCFRSACAKPEEASFDVDLMAAILKGYISEAGLTLTPADIQLLFDAISLLPLELGIRFLTDHLEGDSYFKVSHAGQNLDRALSQFLLFHSIDQQRSRIRQQIKQICPLAI